VLAEREISYLFDGVIELDDTYVGGKSADAGQRVQTGTVCRVAKRQRNRFHARSRSWFCRNRISERITL